jgi:putative AdoMet-dependent methyltransferase
MPTEYPAADFNDWADTYDSSVASDRFPFLGYPQVLRQVVTLADPKPGHRVLDLGTGTGNLAVLFAEEGCELLCTDFSVAMLSKAKLKVPSAHFFLHELRDPLPSEFNLPFDSIVSAYVFHHFDLKEKIRILSGLFPHLAVGGRMIIADIVFQDADAMWQMKRSVGNEWEEEHYWLADESLAALQAAGMHADLIQVSDYTGVFRILPLPA